MDMKTTSHQEMKKHATLLYSAGKPGRGTTFNILTDGTIIIHRKLTLIRIHIPSRIHNWMDIPGSSKGNENTIRMTIIVNEEKKSNAIVNNQVATPERKDKQWFLKFRDKNVMKNKFDQYRDSRISCIISGLQPTKLFYKNKELLEHINIADEKNKKWLLGSKRRGSSFKIYQTNTNQLQIECYCWLGNSGQIELAQELWRYVKDWWQLENKYVIGTINEGPKTVLKFSQRKKKKRIAKKITSPYCGPRKRVKVVFTHPIFELSENTKQDLSLVKNLQQANYNIKQLTTNWTEKSRHPDEEFEEKIWAILRKAFTGEDDKIFSEVKITTASSPKITKRIDGLHVSKELLGLIEIKTSNDLKNKELDEVIGELLLLQEKISKKKTVTILFINTEVTTTDQAINITKLYGLGNGLILIGKEELQTYNNEPSKLIERINELIAIKNNTNQNQIIHPQTYQLTTREKIQQEAFKILQQTTTISDNTKDLLNKYCFLMNITLADYNLLYEKIANNLNNASSFKLKLQNRTRINRPNNNEIEILKKLHFELVNNGNYVLLKIKYGKSSEKGDCKILFDNWDSIIKVLPPSCNIYQFKTLLNKSGITFEKEVREFLEKKGFKVVSNVLFSFYGKHFEVDHLIFIDGNMLAASCKDRSTFQYEPNLYSKIRLAVGELGARHKIIESFKSQLYVKVKEEFLLSLQNIFQEYNTDAFDVVITG